MSGSVNKVILVGNLGADPEGRDAGGGRVVNLRLATSRKYTRKDGTREESTEWHTVILWNKLGELAERYLKKGRSVYIEGRLQTSEWVDKTSGEKRFRTEVVGQEMTFLSGQSDSTPAPRRQSQPRKPKQRPPTGHVGPKSNPFQDEDIPF